MRIGLFFAALKRVRVDENGCWLSQRSRTRGGYIQLRTGGAGSKKVMAHRVTYEALVGPIPEGLTIDHLCRKTNCVNPKHLEAVTMRENLMRGTSFSAINARKTECVNGHEYTPENTGRQKLGRECRECRRSRDRERARAKRTRRVGSPA